MAVNAQDVKMLRDKTGAGIMDCKQALKESNGDFEKATKMLKEKGLAEAKKKSGREAKEGIITVVYSQDGNQVLMVEVNCETDFVSRTDEYRSFVQEIAGQVLKSGIENVNQITEQIKERLKQAIASFGENIVVRRIARFKKLDPEKSRFTSYIHMGGKAGVVVELVAGDKAAESEEYKQFARNAALQIASMAPVSVSRDDVPQEVLEEQRGIYAWQALDSGKPENIVEKIVNGKLNKFYAENCLLEQKYVKESSITVGDYLKSVSQKTGENIQIKRFERFKLGEE